MTEAKKSKSGLFKKISQFFRDLKGEVKKIVWPTKEQAKNNTLVVLTIMLIVGVFIALIDLGVTQLLKLFYSLIGGGA